MGQIGAVPPDHRDVPLGLQFDEQDSANQHRYQPSEGGKSARSVEKRA
jgi:hypothetical protein